MAAHENLNDVRIWGGLFEHNLKLRPQTRTLTAQIALTAEHPTVQVLDPGGAAKDVLLPPEEEGLVMVIVNIADGVEDLVVKEDTDTTTIGTVSQGEVGIFVCAPNAAGTLTWYAMVGGST